MRIGIVSTVATPVRQAGCGSVEGLVWAMSHELAKAGHEVTVFATADSEVCGELAAALPGPYAKKGSPENWLACEMINLCEAVRQSSRFDVLHSHSYLHGLVVQGLVRAPLVNTMHIAGDSENASLWRRYPGACVTAISKYQWSAFPGLEPAHIIYHGVDPRNFTFREEPEDYVCFLGRFTRGKGVLRAIEAARSLGLRLLIAGPRDRLYEQRVAPLAGGPAVEYVGWVGGSERDRLLGGAKALLYPIENPEPFGLVMAEAMMCGTPVAAIGLGAVPEVIDHGVTGAYTVAGGDFSKAVLQALALDRRRVRERALARFSARRMADEYAQAYVRVAEKVNA